MCISDGSLVFNMNYIHSVVCQLQHVEIHTLAYKQTHTQQYHNFGDLIKLSMNRCREANPLLWCKTVVASLKGAFMTHLEENSGSVDQTSIEWADMKELAKKFALSLGFDAMKDNVRQPLVRIHR